MKDDSRNDPEYLKNLQILEPKIKQLQKVHPELSGEGALALAGKFHREHSGKSKSEDGKPKP